MREFTSIIVALVNVQKIFRQIQIPPSLSVTFLDEHFKKTIEDIIRDFTGFVRKGGVMNFGQIVVRAPVGTLTEATPFVVAGLDKVVEQQTNGHFGSSILVILGLSGHPLDFFRS